jgi:RHS repeat-associated protein
MKTATFTYSPQGLLTQEDETGYVQGVPTTHTTKLTYDSRGRMLSSALPRTDVNTTSTMSYFSDTDGDLKRAGQLSGMSDPLGHQETVVGAAGSTYDAFGNVLGVADANGVVAMATYDGWGRRLSSTINGVVGDPIALTDSNTFDGAGRLVGQTRPLGNGVSFTLDTSGRTTSMTRLDAAGNQYERMTFGYDSADEIIAQASQGCALPTSSCANWTTTTATGYAYDAFGELVEVDDAPTNILNSTLLDKKFLGYTNQGRPAVAFDENHMLEGGLTCGAGQLTVQTAETGPISTGTGIPSACLLNYGWTYDLAGRAISAQRFLPAATVNPETNYVSTTYAYDTDDNVNAVTDRNGNVTTFHFDDFGNTLSESSPISGTTTFAYDFDKNLVSVQDATGARTVYSYDALDRPTQSISTKPSLPTETVTWAYDNPAAGAFGIGRLASMSDPAGTTSYTYDRRGLLTMDRRVLDGNVFTQQYAYDANGNRIKMTYADGLTLAYGYDFADRPYSITQVAAGTRAASARTRKQIFREAEPSQKRPTRGTSRGTLSTRSIIENVASSRIAAHFPQIEVRTRGSHIDGNILHVPAALRPREHLDEQARRALMVLSQIAKIPHVTEPRRLNRDVLMTGESLIVSSTTYAPYGPMVSQSFGNGTSQTMQLDARYRPQENELINAAGTVLSNLEYSEDGTGNVIAISDLLDPRFSRAFTYDDMNRLIASVTGPAANVVGAVVSESVSTPSPSLSTGVGLWGSAAYLYDRMGNITTQQIGARVDDFMYSGTTPKMTSVVSSSTVGGSVNYDAAGNETSVGLNSYTYSARNEMINAGGPTYTNLTVPSVTVGSVQTPTLTVGKPWTYKYDGFGTRLSTTVNQLAPSVTLPSGVVLPSVTLFKQPTRYSIPGPEGQLTTETSTTSIGVPEYDYIWMADKPIAQIDATGTHYDFTDHLNAPVIQTNSAGAISYQADYEPYGKIFDLRGLSNPHQPLRLPGQIAEQFEEGANGATDLSYNNNRWYRPEWGQYSQRDLEPVTVSSNQYRYAASNPISFIDPFGLCLIQIRFHWIENGGWFTHDYSHGLLDMTDNTGNGDVTRYDFEPNGDFLQGRIMSPAYSEYKDINGAIYRTPMSRMKRITVINDSKPCGSYCDKLGKALHQVNSACYKYNPVQVIGHEGNSNTGLFALLQAIGKTDTISEDDADGGYLPGYRAFAPNQQRPGICPAG